MSEVTIHHVELGAGMITTCRRGLCTPAQLGLPEEGRYQLNYSMMICEVTCEKCISEYDKKYGRAIRRRQQYLDDELNKILLLIEV